MESNDYDWRAAGPLHPALKASGSGLILAKRQKIARPVTRFYQRTTPSKAWTPPLQTGRSKQGPSSVVGGIYPYEDM